MQRIWVTAVLASCQADPLRAPAPAPAPVPIDAAARACVEVDIGLDLRALPVQRTPDQPPRPSASSIDMFVGGEVEAYRGKVVGPAPQIFIQPQVGGLRAVFDGDDAMARCQRTTTAYLATAPKLPVIMQPAATVTTACGPCR